MLKKLFVVGLFAVVSLAAQGQAGQAYKGLPPVFIGGFFSGIHPDFGVGNTIDGVGAYLDVPIWSLVGVEGELRYGNWHTVAGVKESTYLIGPRVAYPIGPFIPYVKVLAGGGGFTFPFNEGHDQHTVIAYGGGVDYHLTNRFYIRGDFQKQRWSFGNGTLGPTAFSAGVGYRLFK